VLEEKLTEVLNEPVKIHEVLLPILNAVTDCINQVDHSEVYLDGATNILNYPEFRDIMKAKEFLEVLDEKDLICNLLNGRDNSDSVNVQIGGENKLKEIQDCSLITATYSFGNLVLGTVGVIGPTRMEYAKVISSMEFLKKKLNQEITKLIGDGLDDS
jgi:heat-inducible transcriptional repressor